MEIAIEDVPCVQPGSREVKIFVTIGDHYRA
jgi:hypothetical protein